MDVKATIAPSGRIQRGFGRTLLLTTDTTLDAGAGRVRAFASMDEVARVFAPDSSPYQAAQVYFSQVPYPRNLVIGRWVDTSDPAQLTGGVPLPLEEITGRPTVLTGGSPASLDTFHGRATVLTGGSPASLVNFHGRATVLTGTGMVADLVNFHGRATVLTGTGTVADLVNFHGRATVLTGTGTVADLVNFHGRATVLTGTGTVADLVNFHGRATVLTGTGTVASLTTLQGITSGTVTFLSQTVTGLDFSGDNDLDGVASTLQTALRATSSTDLDNVEVDYDSAASAFVVTLPLDSTTGVVPTASATFTGDDADELGLDTATIVNGVDAITSGAITFLSETVTGLDFSDVTDYDYVASVLQTALRATSATSLDEVEVDYDSTAAAFVLTIPLDSTGAATSVSAAFTGTESDELGLDTATIVNGVDAITNGTITFLSETVTGLDFSAVTDYDGVASVLQTALRATSETDLDQVEVDYDSTAAAFVLTLPLDSSTGVVPTASAAFTGDDADELGLDTATIVNGVDAITSGSVTFLSQTVTGLDFSSVEDYDGVASTLQTALRGTSATSLDEVKVAYDGSAFVLTLPLDSQGVATAVATAFTGNTADELGMDSATIVDGVDAITSGSVTFLSQPVTGLDFSAVTDYDGVASVLQAALRGTSSADLAEVEVAYDGSAFLVTLPLDSTTGAATAVTDPFTGNSAVPLGLDTVDTTPGIDGIGAGSLSWQGSTITGLDFTGATSYADVAQTLQTALRAVRAAARADLRSATVTYHPAGFFLVELGFDPSDDEPYPITGYMADVAQGVASDLSLDSDSGGVITQGHTSETIEEGMSAIGALDDSWYFVALDSGITAAIDLLALSRWVQAANNYMLALDVAGDSVLVQGESTSLAAQIAVLEPERTFLVWSRTSDHKALSLAGRLSTVNFDGQNTLITAKFKSLPGTAPDVLTTAQKEELDRKRVGYYTRFGPDAIFAEGWMLNGDWIDSRYWLDWITNAIQTEVYNLLRQHPTRVPQTDSGVASITAAINRVCGAGRRNGGIAPGRVSEALAHDIRLATNNPSFDGTLTLGYLVSVGSIAGQSQGERDARMAPPISVWLKASGAIHSAEVRLIFTN